jgi:hypothetical protein
MGFLFLIIAGLGAIVAIAQLASKAKPKAPDGSTPPRTEGYGSFYSSKPEKIDSALQKGLISLLLKKNIIKEEELLEELEKRMDRDQEGK